MQTSTTTTTSLPTNAALIDPATVSPQVLIWNTLPLSFKGTYTSKPAETMGYPAITVSVKTDTASALTVEFSSDSLNWDFSQTYAITSAPFYKAVQCQGVYVRAKLQNQGSVGQTHLRLCVASGNHIPDCFAAASTTATTTTAGASPEHVIRKDILAAIRAGNEKSDAILGQLTYGDKLTQLSTSVDAIAPPLLAALQTANGRSAELNRSVTQLTQIPFATQEQQTAQLAQLTTIARGQSDCATQAAQQTAIEQKMLVAMQPIPDIRDCARAELAATEESRDILSRVLETTTRMSAAPLFTAGFQPSSHTGQVSANSLALELLNQTKAAAADTKSRLDSLDHKIKACDTGTVVDLNTTVASVASRITGMNQNMVSVIQSIATVNDALGKQRNAMDKAQETRDQLVNSVDTQTQLIAQCQSEDRAAIKRLQDTIDAACGEIVEHSDASGKVTCDTLQAAVVTQTTALVAASQTNAKTVSDTFTREMSEYSKASIGAAGMLVDNLAMIRNALRDQTAAETTAAKDSSAAATQQLAAIQSLAATFDATTRANTDATRATLQSIASDTRTARTGEQTALLAALAAVPASVKESTTKLVETAERLSNKPAVAPEWQAIVTDLQSAIQQLNATATSMAQSMQRLEQKIKQCDTSTLATNSMQSSNNALIVAMTKAIQSSAPSAATQSSAPLNQLDSLNSALVNSDGMTGQWVDVLQYRSIAVATTNPKATTVEWSMDGETVHDKVGPFDSVSTKLPIQMRYYRISCNGNGFIQSILMS